MAGSAVALFVATLVVANGVLARGSDPGAPPVLSRIGHDFLPFYAAGTFVRENRPADMYDIEALRGREQAIARNAGLPLGDGFGPFWNPPFFALPFAALAGLPFRTALLAFLGINLAAAAAGTGLLCRVVVRSSLPEASNWRTWGLVPLLVLASVPFLLFVTHGQNTGCSLLLLTSAVLAWRARRAVLVGAFLGLLSYKPQLAAVVGVIALVDLGWRVVLGGLLTGGGVALVAGLAMPGIFATYQNALPRLLHYMQVEHVYLWERHATLKSFWRLLVQGHAAGETTAPVTLLTALSAGGFGAALIFAAWRGRRANVRTDPARRDRLIAATVAAMPLVMPFYFDYDLLLLAIPAVLCAVREFVGSARPRVGTARPNRGILVSTWCALYLWLIVNPDVAERTRVNGGVVLLACLAAQLVARALRRHGETAQWADEVCGGDNDDEVTPAGGRQPTSRAAA